MMNFNMAITHPSGDINKLNEYVGLELGGGIGAGDKHLGVISIQTAFVTMGPQGNLGRDHAHTRPRRKEPNPAQGPSAFTNRSKENQRE